MRTILSDIVGGGVGMSVLAKWAFTWDEVQHALPSGNGLCLDLGCGDGCHRDWVQTAGWTWIGFDVDVARGGAAIVGDALHLPLADECFEMVLLWQVLEHLSQPWTALLEVSRVLKPGGWVVGSASCLEPFHDVCSYFGFTDKGLEQVLADCGFVDIQIQPGISALSLIARSWFRHLLGAQWGERIAFALMRALFVPSLWVYLFLRRAWNLLRRGELGADYQQTVQWLAQDAPLEFAGHLMFEGRKIVNILVSS